MVIFTCKVFPTFVSSGSGRKKEKKKKKELEENKSGCKQGKKEDWVARGKNSEKKGKNKCGEQTESPQGKS